MDPGFDFHDDERDPAPWVERVESAQSAYAEIPWLRACVDLLGEGVTVGGLAYIFENDPGPVSFEQDLVGRELAEEDLRQCAIDLLLTTKSTFEITNADGDVKAIRVEEDVDVAERTDAFVVRFFQGGFQEEAVPWINVDPGTLRDYEARHENPEARKRVWQDSQILVGISASLTEQALINDFPADQMLEDLSLYAGTVKRVRWHIGVAFRRHFIPTWLDHSGVDGLRGHWREDHLWEPEQALLVYVPVFRAYRKAGLDLSRVVDQVIGALDGLLALGSLQADQAEAIRKAYESA